MKLFTKIALGISGFFFCVAAICLIIASSMGATAADVRNMIVDGKFRFGPEDGFHIQLWGNNDLDVSFGDNDDDSHHSGNGYKQGEITHTCKKIYLKLGAGKLNMYYGDVSNVQIQQKNVPGFSVTSDEGKQTLSIEGGLDVINSSDAELIVILPQDVRLEEVNLEIGASQANVRDIIADKLTFEVGAGKANIDDLSVSKFDIEVGAGQAVIKNLSVEKLDVEAGVGEVDIEIAGAEADYNYDVECGIGQVTIGNRSFGGVGAEQKITNKGANHHMDIECGIGKVKMHFTCDKTEGSCDDESHNHGHHNNY